MEKTKSKIESAVSPVVGVMLMLVVTIIIAAVVSAFAGGLATTQQKAPTLSMDISIANNGYWSGSHFNAKVTGVDQMIPTKDLKIVTKWSKTLNNGTVVSGGATVIPGVSNFHVQYQPFGQGIAYAWWNITSPQGFGPGVDPAGAVVYGYQPVATVPGLPWSESPGPTDYDKILNSSWFGKYSLVLGTSMWAEPFGAGTNKNNGGYPDSAAWKVGYGVNGNPWVYTYGHDGPTWGTYQADFQPITGPTNLNSGSVDGMMAVLGANWNALRAGDIVNVQIIHLPSGKVILNKDVAVTEG